MYALPGLVANVIAPEPTVTVLDEAIDEGDERYIGAVVEDRFKGGDYEEGFGDSRLELVGDAFAEAADERAGRQCGLVWERSMRG